MRIAYFGTPDFAVKPLQSLVNAGFNVIGVVTVPDKPVGRGHKMKYSPVKIYAIEHNIPILQPGNLKDENFIRMLRAWNANLQIVVAFRILPKIVWDMPTHGTFNLHASLLPKYRGAAPINWAIINGDIETGVTTFFLTDSVDTGKIIKQKIIPICATDTATTMHDKLMDLGSEVVLETTRMLELNYLYSDSVTCITQNENTVSYAPKLLKENCCINWNQTVTQIYNFIRGLSSHPTAWTTIVDQDGNHVDVKIFESKVLIEPHRLRPGMIVTDSKTFFKISAIDGFISITSLQAPNRNKLKVKDFLCGFRLTPNNNLI